MNAALRRAIFRSPAPQEEWWTFEGPVESQSAAAAGEVSALLQRVEEAARAGLWAVGYLAYEAAPGFDGALRTRAPRGGPVAAFSFFPSRKPLSIGSNENPGASCDSLTPGITAQEHARSVTEIREAIAAGETYQVNLTFPFHGRLHGDSAALFQRLALASRAPYAAFLDLDDAAVVSLSPELFFALEGERIVMRPMKGTRRRGRFAEEDETFARELRASQKERAENLMIVDMARNDLGRIARPGSVHVTSLHDLERYPTVWQMTSTVEARTEATLPAIFTALYPCASVTGAPKPRAMRFIADLEREPRGVYCGAIGWVAPSAETRRARFSVAIRTATIERATDELTYGVGSGIVWDSVAAAEYDECLTKARALEDPGPPLALIETMRWTPAKGVRFLAQHLSRLAASADYFDIAFGEGSVRDAIASTLSELSPVAHRIRLQLKSDGSSSLTSRPLGDVGEERRSWRAVLAAEPVSSSSPFLFHKSNRREVYDRALAEASARGADEAILWNERGEITEGSRTNLVLKIHGRWLTPARECGLLAGVLRGYLLDRGWVREAVLRKEDLFQAERVAAVSALRGGIRVELA